MARKITIPITDHNDEDVCTNNYLVSYRISGETYWTNQVFYEPPVVVTNLDDDFEYQFKIVRQCCDGVVSAPLELTINTTILSAPGNFSATPADQQVTLNWDVVSNADSYTLERAEDASFTSNLTTIYTDTDNSYNDTGLNNGDTYYYRLKATATNHADSAYATANATPTAS